MTDRNTDRKFDMGETVRFLDHLGKLRSATITDLLAPGVFRLRLDAPHPNENATPMAMEGCLRKTSQNGGE